MKRVQNSIHDLGSCTERHSSWEAKIPTASQIPLFVLIQESACRVHHSLTFAAILSQISLSKSTTFQPISLTRIVITVSQLLLFQFPLGKPECIGTDLMKPRLPQKGCYCIYQIHNMNEDY